MSEIRATTRFVYGIDLGQFELDVEQAVQHVVGQGLEPSVSISHVGNNAGFFHLMAVVTGVGQRN